MGNWYYTQVGAAHRRAVQLLHAADERHAALEGSIPATAFGVLGGTAHPKASVLKIVECAGDVGHLRDRQMHDGAG